MAGREKGETKGYPPSFPRPSGLLIRHTTSLHSDGLLTRYPARTQGVGLVLILQCTERGGRRSYFDPWIPADQHCRYFQRKGKIASTGIRFTGYLAQRIPDVEFECPACGTCTYACIPDLPHQPSLARVNRNSHSIPANHNTGSPRLQSHDGAPSQPVRSSSSPGTAHPAPRHSFTAPAPPRSLPWPSAPSCS